MNEFIFYYTIIGLITLVLVIINKVLNFYARRSMSKYNSELKDLHQSNPEEMFKLLDFIIDSEFTFMLELPFEGKDVKRITDFEANLKELNTAVVEDISPLFIQRAQLLGISEDFIYKYILRHSTIKLLNYMKENNAGITVKNEEEE